MSFRLDRYEPVAFHTHPELMRAAEAQTAVLHPAVPSPAVPPPAAVPLPSTEPPTVPVPAARPTPEPPTVPVPAARPTPLSPVPPLSPATPVSAPSPVSPPASVSPPAPPLAPPAPIAAYVVGMGATGLLRSSLADFLDAAGARRDVRVSVGVAAGAQVSWVLRDSVPYGVRAMPRYPEAGPAPDSDAALAATGAAVATDAADDPGRRQLVVLVWDRPPEPALQPASLASALVLHCVDTVLSPSATNGAAGSDWILARSRPGPQPSLLGHAGRLLDRWEAFANPPAGLWLGRRP